MKPARCYIDFETYCEISLSKCGLFRYVTDSTFDINCMAFCFDGGKPEIWMPKENSVDFKKKGVTVHRSDTIPEHFKEFVDNGGILVAHNAMFERIVMELSFRANDYGFPMDIPLDQWLCTQAKCAVAGLPKKLEQACKALKTKTQKDMKGHNDMLRLASPSPYTKSRCWAHEGKYKEKYLNMYNYCVDDV